MSQNIFPHSSLKFPLIYYYLICQSEQLKAINFALGGSAAYLDAKEQADAMIKQ